MEAGRLILAGAAGGAANMAADSALLESLKERPLPTLRLYGWEPPCLSLGYFQRPEDVCDMDFVRAQGLGLARRPTGGGAILHHLEMTLALALPAGHPAAGGTLQESYARLAGPVRDLCQSLGAPCALRGAEAGPARHEANCFAGSAATDLVAGADKLFGSAQRRKPWGLLFHGSLLLDIDEALWRGAFGGRMGGGFTSLRRLTGTAFSREALEPALAGLYEGLLGQRLELGAMTPAEAAQAKGFEGRFAVQ